jgi:hypothetical protein
MLIKIIAISIIIKHEVVNYLKLYIPSKELKEKGQLVNVYACKCCKHTFMDKSYVNINARI